jgi:tight adherence protein B
MGAAVASFFVLLSGILGAYWWFVVREEAHAQEAFWRRLKVATPSGRVRSQLLKRAQQLSAVPSLDVALARGRRRLQPVEELVEQSGTRMTVGAFLLATLTAAVVAAYIAWRFTGLPLVAIAAAALVGMMPTSLLRFQRTRRVQKFEEQFPEALALISRALKAGHTFTTGLAMVAEEMPAPIGPVFKLLYDQQNFGMPLPDALKEFARRIPLLDARFFVTAVLIQRESGGNLSEILDNIATVIRDRFRVKRQIRVVSAHAKMTGFVLVGVPPALALVLFIINPDHWKTLTGSPLGMDLITAAIVLQVTGTLIIRKMIRIEY